MHSHCCTNNMQSCRLSVNHPGLQKEFNLSHFHTLTLWRSLFSHVARSGTQPTSNACSLYKNAGSCWDGVCRSCCTHLPVLFSHWCIQVWWGMCARELAGWGQFNFCTDRLYVVQVMEQPGWRQTPAFNRECTGISSTVCTSVALNNARSLCQRAGRLRLCSLSRVVSSWSTCLNDWMLSLDFFALDIQFNGCRLCK